MEFKLTIALLLFSMAFVASKNIEPKLRASENETDAAPTTFTGIDYHFVMRMIYKISEEKVPAHLVELIFSDPQVNNITSQDIVNLFNLPELTIHKLLEIIDVTNISVNSVFSIGGLDNMLSELQWQFTEFYNSVISSVDAVGNPVRNALDALHIDSAQFSLGITFGDPDPYVEFKKGNFTYNNMQNATTQLGITLDELFAIIRDNAVQKIKQMNERDVVDIFSRNHIHQHQALAIWHNQSLTMEHVYNVENLRNYLTSVDNALNAQPTLGVAISNTTIAINKEIFMIWKNQSQLIDVSAFAFTTNLEVPIDEFNPVYGEHSSIVTLATNETLNYLQPGQSSHDLENCTLISLVNDNLVVLQVDVSNHGKTLSIPGNATSNVALGSPLVCNNETYGILREVNEESIIFDSFSTFLDGPKSAASIALPMISIMWLCLSMVFRAF